jgi:hypothetical protein
VHWNLMRFDGDPVASIRYDGNAHRSLASGFSSEINLAKVNANRDGDEYDVTNARGHMWMNQMPYQNASPGEWLLWTDEFNIPTSAYDITRIQFHATDSSPERVKVAFAARIEDQWYIYWDGRVETQWNAWRLYSIEFATSGWYRFEPGPAFSINRAEPASLPSGNIDAFGLYMLKDYAWYVNRIDNVTIYVRERVPAPPFLLWQLAHFSGEELLDDSLETTLWGSEADPSTSGISNLARFAFGMDPWQTDMPVAIIPADPQPVLQFAIATAAADAVDVSVHISEDLQNWAPLAQPPQMVESSDAMLLYEVNLPQQPATFSRLIIRPAN